MKEVLEVQNFFAKLADIRRKPTYGSLTEIEDMIEEASHMFTLCTDIHNYLRELEELRDSEYHDHQRILVHAVEELSA